MDDPPTREFGKRRPALPAAESPPVKRSRHVALLMFGTMAVGGAAYALTPRGGCEPNGPGMAAPSSPQAAANCTSRGSSSSGGHGGNGSWSRSNFFGGESSSPSSSSSTTPSGSSETTRGGFGGFARAFAAHFSGG